MCNIPNKIFCCRITLILFQKIPRLIKGLERSMNKAQNSDFHGAIPNDSSNLYRFRCFFNFPFFNFFVFVFLQFFTFGSFGSAATVGLYNTFLTVVVFCSRGVVAKTFEIK